MPIRLAEDLAPYLGGDLMTSVTQIRDRRKVREESTSTTGLFKLVEMNGHELFSDLVWIAV